MNVHGSRDVGWKGSYSIQLFIDKVKVVFSREDQRKDKKPGEMHTQISPCSAGIESLIQKTDVENNIGSEI